MSKNEAVPIPMDDPDFIASVAYTQRILRERIWKLERGSDHLTRRKNSELSFIEETLGDYSFTALFRRHMTIAHGALKEMVKYLKPKDKPTLTPVILARCAIENAGISRWLSEPEPSVVIQRSIERHLSNIRNEKKLLNIIGGSASQWAVGREQALLDHAAKKNIDLAHLKGQRGRVRPTALTQIMDNLDAVMARRGDVGMGNVQAPWSLSSAIIHGADYPERMLAGLTITDDANQLIGVSSIILSGLAESATIAYEDATENYKKLYLHTVDR